MQLILCATTASTQPTILIEAAKGFVADKTYDPKYGARPLNRAIQKYIKDPIAEEILEAEIAQGGIITADYTEGAEELGFSTSKGKGVAISQARACYALVA